MTAVPKDPKISEMRELLRNLAEFRAVYESTGVEEIVTPLGATWSLWDLEYLYDQVGRLTLRQRQAIELCLIQGIKEKQAAVLMGVKATNPVMMYATLGIRNLLDMIERGELERFRARPDRVGSVRRLAEHIRDYLAYESNGCLSYPARMPRLLVRSRTTASGFIVVPPLQIMYLAYVGEPPPGFRVVHKRSPRERGVCVNPRHAELAVLPAHQERLQRLAARYQASLKRRRHDQRVHELAEQYIASLHREEGVAS